MEDVGMKMVLVSEELSKSTDRIDGARKGGLRK
jgi:hypothetical protein